jgi:hypothetical protein
MPLFSPNGARRPPWKVIGGKTKVAGLWTRKLLPMTET